MESFQVNFNRVFDFLLTLWARPAHRGTFRAAHEVCAGKEHF